MDLTTRRLATLVLTTITTAAVSMAQDIGKEDEPEDKKIRFVKTQYDSTVYNILNKDRSKNINELPVPHFAIHTANNKFVMAIGAKINPIIGADMGSDLYKMEGAGINFIPSQIRVPATSGKKGDFYINAFNAEIDLQMVGFGNTEDQITGYIRFSTGGNDNSIHLSKAFITWRGLTAGLKHSLFQDEEAIPPAIDPQGPNGLVNATVNEIGYISPSLKGVRLGIGVDMPELNSSQTPDVPMFVEYAQGMNRMKLAGIVRPMTYRDQLSNARRVAVGWGLSLSGNVKPIDEITIYAQATYGEGIGDYIPDLAGMPLSFLPKDQQSEEMTPTPMMGWMAGVTYDINPKWQVNMMASQARIWDIGSYAPEETEAEASINDYSYGYYGAANVFYNISSYFQIGMEYLYGYRKTRDNGSGHDNRLQFQIQFSL